MASGILNVNKPAGPTSFGVVRSLRRLPGVSKLGHGGTLDPAAEGVLPLLINSATRLADFVHEWPKRYRATVAFGATSDTDDREGVVSVAGSTQHLTEQRIAESLPAFIGSIRQMPPRYSALKQQGESAYRKARRGEPVTLHERAVTIDGITLLAYDPETAQAQFDIRCGRGTYIRSLARDLGAALGCGAYLVALTRLSVGPLSLEQARSPAQILEMGEAWLQALLPMDLPLRDWPAVTLEGESLSAVKRGMTVSAPTPASGRYRIMDPQGELVAWAEVKGERLQPRAVFNT